MMSLITLQRVCLACLVFGSTLIKAFVIQENDTSMEILPRFDSGYLVYVDEDLDENDQPRTPRSPPSTTATSPSTKATSPSTRATPSPTRDTSLPTLTATEVYDGQGGKDIGLRGHRDNVDDGNEDDYNRSRGQYGNYKNHFQGHRHHHVHTEESDEYDNGEDDAEEDGDEEDDHEEDDHEELHDRDEDYDDNDDEDDDEEFDAHRYFKIVRDDSKGKPIQINLSINLSEALELLNKTRRQANNGHHYRLQQ